MPARRGWTWSAAGSPSTAWTRSTARTRPPRARAGAGAPLLRGRGQADRAGGERRATAGASSRSADDLDRHGADRLRRRRPPRPHQRLRRARRRAPRAARRHGLDGQRHRRPGRRAAAERGAGRSCSGARASERVLAEEWARRLGTINYEITCGISRRACRASITATGPAGGRPLDGRARPFARGRGRRGSSAAPCATGCSAGRRSTSTSRSRRPRDARARARRRRRRRGVPLSGAFGAWRVVGPGHAWHVDLVGLRDDDIGADLAARDFTVNAMAEPLAGGELLDPHGGRADLEARRLRMVGPARWPTTRCARCAPSGSPSTSTSRSSRRRRRRSGARRPGWSGSPPSASSASSSRWSARRPSAPGSR